MWYINRSIQFVIDRLPHWGHKLRGGEDVVRWSHIVGQVGSVVKVYSAV